MAGDQPRKGRLNRGGRKPGSKNVVPMQVAEMVQNALKLAGQRLQDGDADLQGMTAGEAYLMSMALREPKSFLALVAKLMPAKLEADVTVFHGEQLVQRLQEGRALAAQHLESGDEQRVH